MLRKGLFALVMLALCFTFVTAETIKGRITKISKDSVSVKSKDKEAKSYPIDEKCKFTQLESKEDKEGKKIEGGVKASVFKDISDKGIGATLVVDDTTKKVTSITLSAKKELGEPPGDREPWVRETATRAQGLLRVPALCSWQSGVLYLAKQGASEDVAVG